MSDVTQILDAMADGDPKAADELMPLVYEELRRLAVHKMGNEPAGHTLQATALVHEGFVRLVGQSNPEWQNRRHFFSAAAEAMRRILIERARRKQRIKHGGELDRVPLDGLEIQCPVPSDDLLAINDALIQLEAQDSRAAELVKLRFFAGLKQKEVAEFLGISVRTADNIWAFARAFLFSEINHE